MENKTSKYFKYAIGEIILVVIGILIALQINNWNEQKKDKQRVTTYAKNLATDIKRDIIQTEYRIRSITRKIADVDSIASYFRGKQIEEIDNLEALYEIYSYYGYRPFNWFKGTFDEIKSSGSLKLFKNDSLRGLITGYYAFTEHLDQDYREDFDISETVRRDMSKIINTNYPNREHLVDTLFMSFRKKYDRSLYFNSSAYKQAKGLNLKLLTNDINQIHAFVNNLYAYRNALRIRCNGEFPRLIRGGEKIIKMIEEEYYD